MGIIRLLLAIAVCNSHFELTGMPMVGGHEAVLTFFAVSGFYMAMVLDRKYDSPEYFYKSRIQSLYPMYLFAVGISAALLFILDIHPLVSRSQMLKVLADPLGFVIVMWTSLCVIGQEWLFSLGLTDNGHLHILTSEMQSMYNNAFLVQGWSLSLEFLFYLLAPFLVRMKGNILFALSSASLLARILIVLTPLAKISFLLRFFPADFWLFGFGILSYRYYQDLPRASRPTDYLAFLILIVLTLTAGSAGRNYEPFFLPMGAIILQPFIFRAFRSLLLDCVIGKIAYPFYLLHYTVIGLFEEYAEDPLGWQVFTASLAAAIITFLLFGPGFEVLKSKVESNSVDTPVAEAA